MKLVIVDCNGTIFDDIPENLLAIMHVCAAGGVARTPDDTSKIHDAYFSRFDGDTLKFYRELNVQLDAKDIECVYRCHYRMDAVRLFDGVHETFEKIRDVMNIPLAFVTSNVHDLLLPLLGRFNLHQYFPENDRAYCARNKAEAIQNLCNSHSAPLYLACYVGDMADDMRAAHKAGVIPVRFKNPHVPDHNFVGDAKPYITIENYAELLDFLYYF